MKKLVILTLLLLSFIFPSRIYAQSMMESQCQPSTDDHTAQEETEGKEIREKLQSKQDVDDGRRR